MIDHKHYWNWFWNTLRESMDGYDMYYSRWGTAKDLAGIVREYFGVVRKDVNARLWAGRR